MSLLSRYSSENLIECGVDEAGRGCIAGPLYTAAVIFSSDFQHDEITDSKQLTRKKREFLRDVIIKEAVSYAVISVSEQKIDEINILKATFWGMNEAVLSLSPQPELLLIDGNRFINRSAIPYQCCIKGDATYLSIAAASILAKTFRDEYMEKIDHEYPEYDWKTNKGYPTAIHRKMVNELGLTPYHRKSFHLKSKLLENQLEIGF